MVAEAEAAHMLKVAGTTASARRPAGVSYVRTGFRGGSGQESEPPSILDRFFGRDPNAPMRVIR